MKTTEEQKVLEDLYSLQKLNLSTLREKQIVTKLLYDVAFRSEVMDFLEIQDFVNPIYRKVYTTFKSLVARNTPFDVLQLAQYHPDISLPTPDKIDPTLDLLNAAHTLHEEGNRYRVRILMNEFLQKTTKNKEDFDNELSKFIQQVNQPIDYTTGGTKGGNVISNFIDFADSGRNKVVGKIGLKPIDDLIEGLELTHVYSIIAAPGVGKSMTGIQIMHESMKMGTTCMYVSNEMSEQEIVSRFVSRETGIPSQSIRRKTFSNDSESELFMKSLNTLHELFDITNSVVFDKAHDIEKTVKAIKYYVLKANVKLVIIDHIHNFRGGKDLFERISNISHILQSIAQELNIAMVILGQISQESQKAMSVDTITAKGAKDLEEVSNVMIALIRKRIKETNAADTSNESNPNRMNFIVTKNRDGRTGQTWAWVSFPSMTIRPELSTGDVK